jgi:glutathione peroxidase-family protein
VLLMPCPANCHSPDHLDRKDEPPLPGLHAQLPQIAIPFMGLPGLTVSTGWWADSRRRQVVSGRYREDLCLAAGEAIEAGGTPVGGDRSGEVSNEGMMLAFYDFTAKSLAGEDVPLKRFEGQVLLIVNTASACGSRRNTRASRAASRTLAARLCGARLSLQPVRRQEPGDASRSSSSVDAICRHLSDVRQDRRQRQQCASVVRLSEDAKSGLLGPSIKWNFTKFLVDRPARWWRATRRPTPEGSDEEKSRHCYERETKP